MSEAADRIKMDNLCAGPAFDDLLGLAVDACLSDPEWYSMALDVVESTREKTDDTALLSNLGMWGLRAAVEQTIDPVMKPSSFGSEFAQAVVEPESLSGPIDYDKQLKIEAFGMAVLAEAFECLGDDAEEKLAAFCAAESTQEKLEVVNWLIIRVNLIARGNEEQEEGDEGMLEGERVSFDKYDYHPARISPQLIGRYPNINVPTTCLGVSVLFASFFARADVPLIHAGVAATHKDHATQAHESALEEVEVFAISKDIMIEPELEDKFKEVHRVIKEAMNTDQGYHAAVLVKLDEDAWLQVDTNYSNSQFMGRALSRRVDEAYDLLQDVNKQLPGFGFMMSLGPAYNSYQFGHLIKQLVSEPEYEASTEQALDLMIKKASQGKDAYGVYKTFMHGHLTSRAKPHSRWLRYYLYHGVFGGTKDPKSQGQALVDSEMKDIFDKYVFPDTVDDRPALAEALVRCQTDADYRARRVEQLMLAAPLFLLRGSGGYLELLHTGNRFLLTPHAEMELGLPYYRIGACVLSDFAVGCGDELPSSFWSTQWPSQVAVTEHLPEEAAPQHRKEQARRLLSLAQATPLQYLHKAGIVQEFLEQGEEHGRAITG